MRRQSLLGRGIIGSAQGQPRYRRSAPGWDVDGSGYAYANPLLGPELVVNGGFDSDTIWSKGSGWTITGGKGVGSAAATALTQPILTVGDNYIQTFDISTYASGSVRYFTGVAAGYPMSAVGSYERAGNAVTTSDFGVTGSAFNGTVDNFSCKKVISGTDLIIRRPNYDSVKISLDTLKVNRNVLIHCYTDIPLQNCIRIQLSNINPSAPFALILTKIVGGASTTLIGVIARTFVDGAEVELRRLTATTFALYYNNAQVGATQTVSDSQIINNDYFVLRSFSNSWKFRSIKFNDAVMPFWF